MQTWLEQAFGQCTGTETSTQHPWLTGLLGLGGEQLSSLTVAEPLCSLLSAGGVGSGKAPLLVSWLSLTVLTVLTQVWLDDQPGRYEQWSKEEETERSGP